MSSYTIVKNAAGEQFIVTNRVRDSAGPYVNVATAVNDSDGNAFEIFAASVEALALTGKTFAPAQSRVFVI